MSELVLVSTHDLPVAGALRSSFEAGELSVALVTDATDLERHRAAASLLVVTSMEVPGGETLARAGEESGLPVFGIFPGAPGAGAHRGAPEIGLTEAFLGHVDPADLLVLGRRVMERRRLQETSGIVGETEAMREVMERVAQIAPVNSTVLVTGESGTGKELVARALHSLSPRKHRPFIAVNVAALPDTLLESELFGHEKGAFTGAVDARRGLFELADRGSIFLDEIGEMPMATQTKLLRVLEQREFLRVGGEKPIRVDVRIIAATNQELRSQVILGEFRRDLYYRLNVLRIELPPLRERREDIPLLVRGFIREVSAYHDRPFVGISREAMEILMEHQWPGNVRELRNLVESMVVLAPGKVIRPEDIPDEIRRGGGGMSLLPVPGLRGGAQGDGDGKVRPELEFVFRTLVDLRVDLDQLRHQFDAYRSQEEGLGPGVWPPSRGLGIGPPPLGDHWPVGTLRALGPGTPPGPAGPPRAIPIPTPGFPGEDPIPVAPLEEDAPGALRAEPGAGEGVDGVVVYRPGMTMEEMERHAVVAALREVDGNRRKAAELLGIGERTLYRKIEKFNLDQ
jgi:DNA-binding NtrC family response regulator